MLIGLVTHVGLGVLLGIFFTAAALSKKKSDESNGPNGGGSGLRVALGNILTVIVAFVALIFIMKFARDYQPRSWINLAALLSTSILAALVLWRLVFSYALKKAANEKGNNRGHTPN
ncbi:MAG: hypothetical protein KF778_04710 [Rhodocyclaceae bacterium]|nr:hypothetical protein [Rhodocyclaceae bacterium]